MKSFQQEESLQALIEELKKSASQVLKIPYDEIDPDKTFFDMGISSLMALELVGSLANLLNNIDEISSAIIFSHPTIAKLARYLQREMLAEETDIAATSE